MGTLADYRMLCGVLAGACAGPNTPLGLLNPSTDQSTDQTSTSARESAASNSDVRIEFSPPRQRLHASVGFTVKIRDERGLPKNPLLRVYYATYDITDGYLALARAERSDDNKTLRLQFPALNLPATRDHEVEFSYRARADDKPRIAKLGAPECDIADLKPVRNTGVFDPPKEWLKAVDSFSTQHRFNPSMVAGLIAQESGFNPDALSWAKAVGLTQITRMADEELRGPHAGWPRSTQFQELTVPHLKYLIFNGEIGVEDDWRLNPVQSIEGALSYLEQLRREWDERMKTLRGQFGMERDLVYDRDFQLRVILASYNSGSARVLRSVKRWGPNFLSESDELESARIYVRKIQSYCDSFGGDLKL